MIDPLQAEIEDLLERLGFELVEVERAGSRTRPVLRLRIDRLDASAEEGVSLEDCVRVSREVERSLDERPGFSPRYVLEVSSPGVERPLLRERDFARFVGRRIAVHLRASGDAPARTIEGELLGLEEGEPDPVVRLRTDAGEEVTFPLPETRKIHLVFEWGGGGRGG